jgi:predicted TPR repeat methyltransferase
VLTQLSTDRMSELYNQFSEVYEAMYQTFINYEEEFTLYHGILSKYGCRSVVEIGCGTGHLAGRFNDHGFMYTGLDRSADMLAIAKKNHTECRFLEADMRSFTLSKQLNAAIITGRTISYLLSNQDVWDAFTTINNNLLPGGILCFDFINAHTFIPAINEHKKITHSAAFNGKQYERESFWKVNLLHSWSFDWDAVYFEKKENGERVKIGEDRSTIRTFTKGDILLFLKLCAFEVKEIIPRATYAFDTFVVVAEKLKPE